MCGIFSALYLTGVLSVSEVDGDKASKQAISLTQQVVDCSALDINLDLSYQESEMKRDYTGAKAEITIRYKLY